MDYAKSRGVSVMVPITAADLQKPVFKKYWGSNVAKRTDVPQAAGVNKIDMSKFANLESFFKQQSREEVVIEPVPAVPVPAASPSVAERPGDPQSRDLYTGSEYIFGLNSCNFRQFIERKNIAVVMFYGDEEREEEKTMWARAQLNKSARISKRENHGYAAVNCTLYPELCQSEGVCKTPMYKVYSNGNVLSNIQEVCTIHAKELKMLVENAPSLAQPRGPVSFNATN